jgi:serine/threonine-protein kinase
MAETHGREDFRTWNLTEWETMLNSLFPTAIPARAIWKARRSIIAVLQKIGSVKDLTHFFYPDGGGLDLDGARQSVEAECIELDTGVPTILKPRKLTFESFGRTHLEWAYFRLEAATLEPSGVYDDLSGCDEELAEIRPGFYVSRSALDSGEYEEDGEVRPTPETARGVMRYLRGTFVVFAKASTYNRTPTTYDGRHAKMPASAFRAHIAGAVRTTAA